MNYDRRFINHRIKENLNRKVEKNKDFPIVEVLALILILIILKILVR